jgi:H+/Cl- antiporter ClcA
LSGPGAPPAIASSRRRGAADVVVDVAIDGGGGAVVGALAGLAAAVFLAGLAAVTTLREARASWLVPLLPLAAAALLELVARLGARVGGGTAVVLEVAHRGGEPIPLRLAVVALLGTWWTHLFGGSAGREGTAVQMGSALADAVVHAIRRVVPVDEDARRRLVIAGIAGGFGGVFGTPVAGAVFAMEVVVARRLDTGVGLAALTGALVGDLVGDATLHALGGAHGVYPTLAVLPVTPALLVRFAVLGLVVGVVGRAFIALQHAIKARAASRPPWQRGLVGGAVVVALWAFIPGGHDLVGLSLPTLAAAVQGDVGAILPWAFALKLVLTAVTLGVGLIGGEVTPLFVIGATLGVVVAGPLGLPPEQAACAALAAMFGACATAPLALLIMVVELCGAGGIAHQLVCVVVASVVVGRHSIYTRPPAS